MTNELRQGQLWEDARAISTSLALLAELQSNLGRGGRVAREILILTAAAVVDHSAVYLENSSSNESWSPSIARSGYGPKADGTSHICLC